MSDQEPIASGDNITAMQRQFYNDVAELGVQGALGQTALTRLAMRVIKAASDGLIQPDQARDIYQHYAEASKNAGGTPASIRTNASKLRKLIELGCLPEGEGLRLAEKGMQMRDAVENAKPPFDALVEVARCRLQADSDLTDDEIKATLTKAPKREKPKAATSGWGDIAKQVSIAVKDKSNWAAAVAIRDELEAYIASVRAEERATEDA